MTCSPPPHISNLPRKLKSLGSQYSFHFVISVPIASLLYRYLHFLSKAASFVPFGGSISSSFENMVSFSELEWMVGFGVGAGRLWERHINRSHFGRKCIPFPKPHRFPSPQTGHYWEFSGFSSLHWYFFSVINN